jgi:thiol-disulfide isomerase/thioredoxin
MSHGRPRVIFFFMTGCPHCDRSWPAWDKAKSQLRSVADVSETESAEVSPRDGVSSFPTFVVLRGNREVTRVEGAQEDPKALIQALGLRRRRARGRRTHRRGRHVTKRTLRNYKAL